MKKVDETTGKECLYSLADLKRIISNTKEKIKDIDRECSLNYGTYSLIKIQNVRRPVSELEGIISKANKDIENGNYSDYVDHRLFH